MVDQTRSSRVKTTSAIMPIVQLALTTGRRTPGPQYSLSSIR
ncbi:hypothetical protein RRSWK_02022 [Rhodopirellula sp. SWK7]|nr:hypothetical protein RRSWK_02022 [Rhodopirellula sp. SWK7]